MVVISENKQVVVPGDLLSDNPSSAGDGTYVEDGKVYSLRYGVLEKVKDKLKVIPLSGKYIPQVDDIVIGKVIDINFSGWNTDINAPYDAFLRANEYFKRVDADELSRHLKIGDLILAKIIKIDAMMRIDLTLNEPSLRALRSGRMVEISTTRIPRLIGRSGSMINMLKKKLKCDILIGQNGWVWVSGSDENVDLAIRTIMKVDEEAHTSGLTDRISEFIEKEKEKK